METYPSPATSGLYNAKTTCELVGCTYRQLDYWSRLGVIAATRGACGSGSRRLFSIHDVAAVALINAIADYMRYVHHLGALFDMAMDLPLDAWPGTVWLVDSHGQVWLPGEDAPAVTMAVHLGALLAQVQAKAAALAPA